MHIPLKTVTVILVVLLSLAAYGQKVQLNNQGASVYSRSDFHLTAGNAYDLLRLIPQLEVGTDGTISISGNGEALVMINNRPAASGGDYRPVLNQIMVEMIEDVEVITGSSARYDAEASGGIVNINILGDGLEGTSGTVEVKAQTGEKGELSGGVMVKKAKWGSQLNVNARQYRTRTSQFIDTEAYHDEDTVFTKQVIHSSALLRQLASDFSFDYSPNEFHTIELSGGLVGRETKVDSELESHSSEDGDSYNSTSNRQLVGNNNRMSVNYTGLLSGNNEQKKELNAVASYFQSNSQDTRSTRAYFTDFTDSDFLTVNMQADYKQALQNQSMLETGIRSYLRNSNMNYGRDSAREDEFESTMARDNFQFRENVHAGYIQVSGKTDWLHIKLGMRSEVSKVYANQKQLKDTFTKEYLHFFPSANLSRDINKNHTLGINYNKSIRRPRMNEMNPFIRDENPANIHFGNPDLNPSITHNIELKYTGGTSAKTDNETKRHQTWQARLAFRESQNSIYRATLTSEDEGVTETSFYNIKRQYDYTIELMYSREFLSNSRLDFIPSYRYMFQDGRNIDNSIKNESGYYQLRINANIGLWPNAQLLVKGFLRSSRRTPQGMHEAFSRTDFSLRQTLFENKLTITLDAINPLRETKLKSNVIHEEFKQERETRFESNVFRITARYNFGKMKLKNKDKNTIRIIDID